MLCLPEEGSVNSFFMTGLDEWSLLNEEEREHELIQRQLKTIEILHEKKAISHEEFCRALTMLKRAEVNDAILKDDGCNGGTNSIGTTLDK